MKKIIIIFLSIFYLGSCTDVKTEIRKKTNSNILKKEDSIYKELYINIDVKDQISSNTEYEGVLKFYHPLQDSIKLTKGDLRFAITYLNIFNKDRDIKTIKKIECDSLFHHTKKINDTLLIPFKIKSKSIENGFIGIILEEEIYLEGYKKADSLGSRALLNTFIIKEDIKKWK